jgi:adenine-specific DNA-methyltransferase
MTAIFPYYHLYSDVAVQATEKAGKIKKSVTDKPDTEKSGDIRQGFVYEEVPHITLKSLANDEPPSTETLYDKPLEDKKKLRVCGPFTVETLQNYEPVSPDAVTETASETEGMAGFEERVFDHLKSAGVKNGIKNEQAVFIRIERLVSSTLHAEGFYQTSEGEKKAYFHIGPKFGTVSKHAVNEAVKECRQRGDANWLIILGFSFESDITSSTQTTSMGTFEVTKARMHDDLMQDGLMKKDKKAGSFITIGEPDIKLHKAGIEATVEICGLDIYDPIKDEVKARNVADIAYWMVDDDYDGSNFVVKQLFFCGGSQDEFSQWKKGLSDLARTKTRRNAEKTLKIEIDDEAFDRLYGFMSHPIPIKPNRKIAVRVISQFGEESMKVMDVTGS